jgi:hypothetical protein
VIITLTQSLQELARADDVARCSLEPQLSTAKIRIGMRAVNGAAGHFTVATTREFPYISKIAQHPRRECI